jgi:hypothetical protein
VNRNPGPIEHEKKRTCPGPSCRMHQTRRVIGFTKSGEARRNNAHTGASTCPLRNPMVVCAFGDAIWIWRHGLCGAPRPVDPGGLGTAYGYGVVRLETEWVFGLVLAMVHAARRGLSQSTIRRDSERQAASETQEPVSSMIWTLILEMVHCIPISNAIHLIPSI